MQKIALRLLALTGFILLAFYFGHLAQNSHFIMAIISDYGYIGIFLISILGGFNLIVPVPSIAFIPLILAAGLSFWPAVIIITLGSTIADSTSFFVGRMAKNITGDTNNRVIREFQKAEQKNKLAPILEVFLFISFAPIPAEVILVPMGYLGYRFIRVLPIIFISNMIFNTLLAFGMASLFNQIVPGI